MPIVLIADDELNIRRMVGALLSVEGYEVAETPSGVEAVARVKETEPDVALVDLMMPGDLDGMATLARLREVAPDLPVIMMSGRAGLADAVKATKLGAFNFLEKPLTPEGVLLAVSSALELRQTRRVARQLRAELGFSGQMVGNSPAMRNVRQMIARVAPTDARVLITGESGTGKELVASAIHDASPRRDKPFVRVNCAAIPKDLVESEMFGHERGAFTGATQTRIGRFELAHHGTLFLDEVGDLGPDAQAKLLRAIEAQEIQRVGGNRVIRTDVRIISATNHDLQRAVKAGTFREDLFFRLQVIPLAIPPLRERGDDILELVEHFSEQFLQRSGQAKPRWRSDALQLLRDYPWPGNVRELANIVERLAILHPGAEMTGQQVEDVLIVDREDEQPPTTPTQARERVSTASESARGPVSLADRLDSFERTVIARALADAGGNVADAARRLQTDRPNLYRRMKRLGIKAGLALFGAFVLALPARAQNPDTTASDTLPAHGGWWARTSRSSGLILSSGKTYNRVEGLPVLFGPVFHDSVGAAQINASVLGIIRSANTFHWDNQNLGHRAGLDVRVGRGRGYGLGLSSYDVMQAVEPWHLPDPDAGLAAFFGHRDFRDWYNRHGAMATATYNMSAHSSLSADISDERWASPDARRVFSVFGNGKPWRANPTFDAGRFHIGVLRANVDTRNDQDNPSTGWLIAAEYEHGVGDITDFGLTSPIARTPRSTHVSYGRGLVDLRRYNRLSPTTWINGRLVLGGWLHGDDLPLQRRFSIGGIGTVPGFDFRKYEAGTVDVAQCSDGVAIPVGNPAQCERVALAQLEYRQEVLSSVLDFLNARPIRLRGIGFTVRPTLVAFVDAGRGWLVGQPSGTLQYSSRSFPRFGTFRTDVGLGLDLGIVGVYAAKAVSSSKEPANVFLRVHRRF